MPDSCNVILHFRPLCSSIGAMRRMKILLTLKYKTICNVFSRQNLLLFVWLKLSENYNYYSTNMILILNSMLLHWTTIILEYERCTATNFPTFFNSHSSMQSTCSYWRNFESGRIAQTGNEKSSWSCGVRTSKRAYAQWESLSSPMLKYGSDYWARVFCVTPTDSHAQSLSSTNPCCVRLLL